MQSSNGWVGGLGMGYQFAPWFRADASVEFRNTLSAGHTSSFFDCITGVEGVTTTDNGTTQNVGVRGLYGKCFSKSSAHLKRIGFLANGYVDMGAWGGVTPYVGIGVGVTRGAFSGKSNWHTSNDGSEYAPEITAPDGFPATFVASSPAPENFTFGKQSKRVSVSNSSVNFTWALMAGLAYDISAHAKLDVGYRFLNQGTFAPGSAERDSKVHELRIGVRYMVE